MSDSEMQKRITELVQGLWADGYAEGSRGKNVPPSKKRLNRTEAENALMSLFTEEMASIRKSRDNWKDSASEWKSMYEQLASLKEEKK